MSKPVDPSEIITGMQRRWRYTAEEKVRLVEQNMQPGITVSAVARLHGGVVVDAKGLMLLHEPRNHFDGYVWTFPKGRPDEGETPEQAALREVREETGYAARIIAKLEGSYVGGTTVTEYFMMEPVGSPTAFDSETASIRWAKPDEAEALIAMTTNKKGRERDLAVLKSLLNRRKG